MLKGFVINLDNRPERYQQFLDQTSSVKSIDIERVSAVNKIPDELVNKDAIKKKKTDFNYYGTICCALSHLSVYRKIATSDKPNNCALVFEDDFACILPDIRINFDRYINKVLEIAPKDFDVIYLNDITKCVPKYNNIIHDSNFKLISPFESNNVQPTCESYIISKGFATELIEYIEQNIYEIDILLVDYVKQFNKKAYVLNNPLGCQYNRTDTDIQRFRHN